MENTNTATQTEQFEVVCAYNGTAVNYGPDAAEYTGSEDQCQDYIDRVLDKQRRHPGQQNTGTFLAVRNVVTGEWI